MKDTGVSFVKSRCAQNRGQVVEFGGGVALGDYDGDGDLDIYFVQGGPNVLYRNEGNWRFIDVTSAAGVGNPGEGRAASWGDFDNDGCLDLYVANMKTPNVLYRNNCDGTFADITEKAGAGYSGYTSHVAWGDYDRNGCLDIYLANYADPKGLDGETLYFSYRYDQKDGEPNRLYRNNCDGTFAEATTQSGTGDTGYSLSAAWTDLDGDGWPDLYIANDFGTNTLYRNLGSGKFEDVTNLSGTGYRGNGMGVDSGDYDNDADLDLYVPNIVWLQYIASVMRLPRGTDEKRLEMIQDVLKDPKNRTLQRIPQAVRPVLPLMVEEASFLGQNRGSDGELAFDNVARSAGVSRVEWGWGGVFFDADSDGWQDLYVGNGMDTFDRQDPHFQRLPNRLFRNLGNGTFEDATTWAGADDRGDSRGVAYGDLDNDGDLDLVVVNHQGPARLYQNVFGSRNHWLIVNLVGACGPDHRGNTSPAPCSNQDGIGAWVTLRTGNRTLLREIKSGSGFASGSMIPAHFGLGSANWVDMLEVRWPSGKIQRIINVSPDRTLTVREPG